MPADRTLSHPDPQHGHDDHAAPHAHGSRADYIKGFLLSVILTAIPFAIVMSGGFDSRGLTALVVIGFAVVQILVHMVYFLHMTGSQEEGWTLMSTIFTVVVVVILLAGSLWVMYHMNTNMMPQMDHELLQGLGS
ncbi:MULTISPECIES: cytochrome o ubiquinol oxidase subunit IV [unclassified Paracoccus (in: a-proteobacteria)]|uniref:cytochrome o ubiquinol oxidase subunit IV n=1 Tax=unclassified Paracoccus (in: a-proteobacteria) TaxID=2688777 RepID=UPI0012B2B490|nr:MULTISPECIES: cytochrome o ubiquinol oxidase subunit IV [unclassified Paracoccus (in: a-proteobacteria)]UXU76613.1 cytochrome o ubiquinol oxidase subunit IV [Paracoccus sp. SMMA_5]UXU82500.1 cytochrome o ubiquinol oxidase subunit IV [Paracoccus sp. SMMA_5_TC]